MEESAKGGGKNRKSRFCSSSVPRSCPAAEPARMAWGEALRGGGGRGRREGSPVGNHLIAWEEEARGARAAPGRGRAATPLALGGAAGTPGWELAGALRVGLRAPGGESSAGRWQPPRGRPPAKEQPAAVPGGRRRRGST